MSPPFATRPSQVIGGTHVATELDDHTSHMDSLLGDPYADADAESLRSSRHPDPDMESIRSLHSRASHVDSLLTRPLILDQTKRMPPPGPNKLHRRRNQYPHFDNRTVTIPESTSSHHENSGQQQETHHQSQHQSQSKPDITRSKSTRDRQATADNQQGQSHRRAKSYTLAGGPSSWLLSNSLVDVRRSGSLTGERREIRKLQKDHPAGSARPSLALEIGDGDGGSPPTDGGERGSGLGVRRKMGRLRGLYRK
ncbi:hypothetical protein INS49_001720 [Diaporthe citri]|uniref:uncharacterized protein n=1 Tax=Diaporthe citri TaxID=83186 RepID=UPI001C803D3C|nr:uncharacterized protein INS49_001720 [Diaporthe citri]KAG6367529.1 hypothetical protein INS49_001720 [Diaporthe citri]